MVDYLVVDVPMFEPLVVKHPLLNVVFGFGEGVVSAYVSYLKEASIEQGVQLGPLFDYRHDLLSLVTHRLCCQHFFIDGFGNGLLNYIFLDKLS